jgi:pimeloyl-ACP methyl ester carboxylesterase
VASVREFEADDARSAGPAVVWRGPAGAPAVVVLDPAGEAKHNELPATWRPLAEHLRVGWCRLPAEVGEAPAVTDVLVGLADGAVEHVHLVAGGTAAEPALRLAARYRDVVRTVVAVDPAPGRAAAEGESPTDWWDRETAGERGQLTDAGVRVRCFVSRDTDPSVRVERPVPLGHPDVVGRLVETLLSDRQPGEGEPEHRAEVAEAWQTVREHVGGPLERARASGS